MTKTTDIKKYKRKWHMNIGIIIFAIIFIYLMATLIMYLMNPKITIYEVRDGSILRDTAYTGFVIREEKIVKSDQAGHINYLTPELSKVGAKSNIYALSDQPIQFKNSDAETNNLTAEEQAILLVKTQSFSENYSNGQFTDIYTLKNDISSMLESKSSQNKLTQILEMKETMGNSLSLYNAQDDGVIVYSTDGYESITPEKITEDILNKKGYEKTIITDNSYVESNSPVYKLITNEKWTVAINLDDATAKELEETKSIKVRFTKDNITANASFNIQKSGNLNLGLLTFHSSMIRYAQERYIDLELILEDESGLKIPKSAVVKKDFYVIPKEYITVGGDSKNDGVLLKTNKKKPDFLPVSYHEDLDEGVVYVNPLEFDKNIILKHPKSSETFQLGETKHLLGVYNINKGYALFKQIRVLCESEEYYIVEEGSSYGLSNYDHIALDGSVLKENDVVFN